jgi:hypothetical protein
MKVTLHGAYWIILSKISFILKKILSNYNQFFLYFRWADGYSVRFGLTYVNFSSSSRNRIPKQSAFWFNKYIYNYSQSLISAASQTAPISNHDGFLFETPDFSIISYFYNFLIILYYNFADILSANNNVSSGTLFCGLIGGL